MKYADYLAGRTTYFACQADPRFSYCLYAPQDIQHICVYVHGTYRDAEFYRNHLQDFAEAYHVLSRLALVSSWHNRSK